MILPLAWLTLSITRIWYKPLLRPPWGISVPQTSVESGPDERSREKPFFQLRQERLWP